jgi:Cdc6-like AAA superfamily ATPase
MKDLDDRYLKGMSDLLQALDQSAPDYLTALTLQGRLAQAISEIRQYGPTDNCRAEIARVTTELDRLSLAHLGKSFRSHCGIDEAPEVNSPKVYHNLPQPDYGQFVGREQELAKMYELLSPTNRHFLVTIDGIGGIGKSALALEVAHRYLRDVKTLPESERFDGIIWASAKRTTLTAEGIVQRRQALRTLDDIYTTISVTLEREDIARIQPEKRHEIVRKILTRQRVLLIVDNLETVDDEMVMEFLHELPVPTKAIVTTRHRLDVAYPVRLGGMSWDDVKALIKQECEKKVVELTSSQTRQLYDQTGGVPLAIVWSIAQMGFGQGVDSVLTRLSQPKGDIARFCFDNAMERIRDTDAHRLLMGLALVATESTREALGHIAGMGADTLSRDQGLAELEKLSFVNNRAGLFSMLPLTATYVGEELSKYKKFAEEAIQRWVPLWFQANPQFYIERPADEMAYKEISQGRGATISIQGSRQTGKSSLVKRILESAKASGAIVLKIDLALLGEQSFASPSTFLYSVAEAIIDQLEMKISLASFWNKRLPLSDNMTELIEVILSSSGSSVILSLDSVDRLLPFPIKDDFFGMIRSWHNMRARDAGWQKLTIVMALRSEPHLLIDDRYRAPFNVGLRIMLDDFNNEQAAELNRQHGSPLRTSEELRRLQELVGGHPHLLQTAFYTLTVRGQTLDNLLDVAQSPNGPFGVHLRECQEIFDENLGLHKSFIEAISSKTSSNHTAAETLRSLGFVLSETGTGRLLPRCSLYSLCFGEKPKQSGFFIAGGTLAPTVQSYLPRNGDALLLQSLKEGRFCYVLEPRQTGKSSLMVHVGHGLESIGYEPVFSDLALIGRQATTEEACLYILHEMSQRLQIEDSLEEWWHAREQLNMRGKLISFVQERLFSEIDKHFVLFLDEIDIGLAHPDILDELFAFVRSCYANRAADSRFKCLDFVVLGVADPNEIFSGEAQVLRKSGREINLQDFTREEIIPLESLLYEFNFDPSSAKSALDRIYYWTDGHPYLTQRLCSAVSELPRLSMDDTLGRIDRVAQDMFLQGEASERESNLRFIANYLLASANKADILQIYKRILAGKQILFDDRLPAHRRLRASGIVIVERDTLRVRNRIYSTVFNKQWVEVNSPVYSRLSSWLRT